MGKSGQEQLLTAMRPSIKMADQSDTIDLSKSDEPNSKPSISPTGAQKRKSSTPVVNADSLTGNNATKRPKIASESNSDNLWGSHPNIEELDSSMESSDMSPTKRIRLSTTLGNEDQDDQTFDAMQKNPKRDEFSCDYCSNNVSFPIFNLLIVHIKSEHASKF